MKKYFIIIFTVVILFILSACQETDLNENINNNDNNNSEEVNNEEGIIEEDDIVETWDTILDVSYMSPMIIWAETEENFRYLQNKILDKFGINISICPTPGEDKPGVDLLVAGNGLPDCGWIYCCSNAAVKSLEYYNGGAIQAIPIEKIVELAPEYYSILQEDPTFDILLTDEEDSYHSLAAFRYGNTKLAWTIITRYDWIKNLGIHAKGNVANLYDYLYITDEAYTVSDFTDLIY